MSKNTKSETQLYRLYLLLLNGSQEPGTCVSKETIVAALGIKESSVPVYIHTLKKKFGAAIENVSNGRSVSGYVIKNTCNVPQFKKAAGSVASRRPTITSSPVKVAVDTSSEETTTAVLDRDVDTEYSEREHADIIEAIGYTPGDY